MAIYLAPDKQSRIFVAAIVMVALSGPFGARQWYSLAAIPLLMLYNERRGKAKLKYLFYVFYPVHLVVIYFVGQYLL